MAIGAALLGVIGLVVAWWLIRRLIVLVLVLILVAGIAVWAEHPLQRKSLLPHHALPTRVLHHAEKQGVRTLRHVVRHGG